jgi:hypothetical protein
MTPEERAEIEKEIAAIQEELGIVPADDADSAPSDLASSYDRISDLYHRRKHLMARLDTNAEPSCTSQTVRFVGHERRRGDRRQLPDRRASNGDPGTS